MILRGIPVVLIVESQIFDENSIVRTRESHWPHRPSNLVEIGRKLVKLHYVICEAFNDSALLETTLVFKLNLKQLHAYQPAHKVSVN